MSTTKKTEGNPLKAISGAFLNQIISGSKKPDENPKPPETKPDPDPVVPDTQNGDPDDGKERSTKAAPVVAPQPPIDISEIVSAAAEGAARGTRKIIEEQRAEAKKEEEAVDYPEQYKEEADELDALATLYPEKYSNLKQRLVDIDKSEAAYMESWKHKNPGSKFNPEDEEHSEFYAQNDVTIPAKHRAKAREHVTVEKSAAAARNVVEKDRRERQVQQISASIPAQVNVAIGGALVDLAKELSGIDIDQSKPESFNSIETEDPTLARIALRFLPPAQKEITAALQLGSGVVRYDPKNESHKAVADITRSIHETIMQASPDKREVIDGGVKKKYASPIDFERLSESQRKFHWTITPEHVASTIRERAKSEIRDFYLELKPAKEKSSGSKTTQTPQGQQKVVSPLSQGSTSSTFGMGSGGSGPAVRESKPSNKANTSGLGAFATSVLGRG